MVSSEGACAAFFSYGRLRRPREEAPVVPERAAAAR